MTTANALGFLLLGLVMILLPPFAPGWFPPDGLLDGTSTSALWLEFMGWVNDLVGAWFVACDKLWPLVRRALAWTPPAMDELVPGEILRPAAMLGCGPPADDQVGQPAAA